MLRGSRPGERRGGRKRDTPNRRTILTNTILAIGADKPTASWRAFLLKLVKDQRLPADTRMAVIPKCLPAKRTRSSRTGRSQPAAGIWTNNPQAATDKVSPGLAFKGSQVPAMIPGWNPQAFEALFGVVQDANAEPKARRKAARTIAEFLLPKVGKKAKTLPDEYGFSVNSNLASAYRDIQLELRALVNKPTHVIPAIAERIKKLEARADAVRRRLQVPCPTLYGNEEATKDCVRWVEFTTLRDNEAALTEVQMAEEAHVKVRYDVFVASPERVAGRRRRALQDAERRFKMGQSAGDLRAAPLSRKERSELKLLRWLYPKRRPDLSELDGGDEVVGYHPFQHELPAADGNFYPRHSKLRPPGAADALPAKTADGPPISPVSLDPIQSAEPQKLK